MPLAFTQEDFLVCDNLQKLMQQFACLDGTKTGTGIYRISKQVVYLKAIFERPCFPEIICRMLQYFPN